MRMTYDATTHKGTLNWGSWTDDHWLLQKFKPCMLRTDGSVDYYLNRTDFTKKADGTASDYNNPNYDGNAMVQIGQIWIKEEKIDDNHFHISLASNPPASAGFDCWSHMDVNNVLKPYCYKAMYRRSLINGKMRSIAGQTINTRTGGETQRQYCQANGTGYDAHYWSLHRLLQYVIMALTKTTNVPLALGYGNASGISPITTTGGNEMEGMFMGYNDETHHNVVLGIEDLWGNMFDLTMGWIRYDNQTYVKMTPNTKDGTAGTSYGATEADLTGYYYIGRDTCAGNGNVTAMNLIPGKGLFIKALGPFTDPPTTNYCNRSWLYGLADKVCILRTSGSQAYYGCSIFTIDGYNSYNNARAEYSASLTYV